MAKVFVAVGLGFGDEGKGSVTDALVRQHNAKLVIRFNGGAQAAHHVVLEDSRFHCFSQFGSGTLAGADTLLSRYMLINPVTFLKERDALVKLKVNPKVYLEENALITTPFHVAANRIREMARFKRHGSCGMGIGETMDDYVSGKECLTAFDLTAGTDALKTKLSSILYRKRTELESVMNGVNVADGDPIGREWSIFNDRFLQRILGYYKEFTKHVTIVDENFLTDYLEKDVTVVFEGSQGVLLDQDFGFQPYATWTDCTFNNALRLLEGHPATRLGILRAYQTRHGNGPFPTEEVSYNACSAHDHNGLGEWQGAFRSGPLDLVLTKYALDVTGGVDGLVITNLDRLEYTPGSPRVCIQYREPSEVWTDRLEVHRPADLGRQAELSRWLMEDIQPVYESIPMYQYAEQIAERLKVPLAMTSFGPTAKDKQIAPQSLAEAV
jgi:adenylosuccinate synthase